MPTIISISISLVVIFTAFLIIFVLAGIREFIIFIVTAILFIVLMGYTLHVGLKKYGQYIKNDKLDNPSISSTIIIITIISTSGFFIMPLVFPPDLPRSLEYQSEDNISARMQCSSPLAYDKAVVGFPILCQVEINRSNLSNFSFITTKVVERVDNNKVVWNETSEVLTDDHPTFTRIPINVQKEGYHETYIDFTFSRSFFDNKSGGILLEEKNVSSPTIEYAAISQSSYDARNNQKIAYILAVISLSVVASISTVKSLMEIWDRPKRKKEEDQGKRGLYDATLLKNY